jgi:hypothetical protein
LRTANGWLIVSIDGHETQVCYSREIEYLHLRSGGNSIDMTGIETELLSPDLVIDLNGGAENGTMIGRADADCLVLGDAIDQFSLGEGNLELNADQSDGGFGNEILDSLFCDVAFIDTAKLTGVTDKSAVEEESFVAADDTIAEDEALTELRRGGPNRLRVRPGMELNL